MVKKATQVRAVWKIWPQKEETHWFFIIVGGNLITSHSSVIMPTEYLTIVKLHLNSFVFEPTARYMYMNAKKFYHEIKLDK